MTFWSTCWRQVVYIFWHEASELTVGVPVVAGAEVVAVVAVAVMADAEPVAVAVAEDPEHKLLLTLDEYWYCGNMLI